MRSIGPALLLRTYRVSHYRNPDLGNIWQEVISWAVDNGWSDSSPSKKEVAHLYRTHFLRYGCYGRWTFSEFKKLAPNCLARRLALSLEEDTVFSFYETRGASSALSLCGLYKRPKLLPLPLEAILCFTDCLYLNLTTSMNVLFRLLALLYRNFVCSFGVFSRLTRVFFWALNEKGIQVSPPKFSSSVSYLENLIFY